VNRFKRLFKLTKSIGLYATFRIVLNRYFGVGRTPKANNFYFNLDSLSNFLNPKFSFKIDNVSPYDVTFVIPEIREDIFYGGYLAFLGFLNKASEEGLTCRIVLFNQNSKLAKSEIVKITSKDTSQIFQILNEVDIGSFITNTIQFNEHEIVVTYNAHITNFLDQLSKQRMKKNVFLFQEDERIFFPNGSIRASIEQTYKGEFFPVYSSPLLKNEIEKEIRFDKKLQSDSLCFINPILLPSSNEIATSNNKKRLIIYARPESHASRNLTEIAFLGALRFMESQSRKERDSWELIGVGGNSREVIKLSDEIMVQMLGKLTLQEYSNELAKSSLGLSLMYAPHPSIPPFEFTSFGIPTVTNSMTHRTPMWYQETSNLFFVCDFSIESISEQLRQASIFQETKRPPVFPKSYSESLSHFSFKDIDSQLSLS
jgi:hypothetical protein